MKNTVRAISSGVLGAISTSTFYWHHFWDVGTTSAWNFQSLTFSLAASWHNLHINCLVDTHLRILDSHYIPDHLIKSRLLEG